MATGKRASLPFVLTRQFEHRRSGLCCQAKAAKLQLVQARLNGRDQTSSFGIKKESQRADRRDVSQFRHTARPSIVEHDHCPRHLKRKQQHLCLTRSQTGYQRRWRRTDRRPNSDPRQTGEVGQIHAS